MILFSKFIIVYLILFVVKDQKLIIYFGVLIMKKFFSVLIEIIFSLAYVSTIVLAILDIMGIANFIQIDQWTKILVMLFGTVGIAVLWDKRKLEVNIDPKIDLINTIQKENIIAVLLSQYSIVYSDRIFIISGA